MQISVKKLKKNNDNLLKGSTLKDGRRDLRDLVAPDGIIIEQDHLRIGSRYMRVFFISQMPVAVWVGFLDTIYSLGDVEIGIHLQPGDDQDVINELSTRIAALEAKMIIDEKNGDSRTYSLTKRTWEDAWQLREEIQTNQNKMFFVSVVFSLAAPSKEALDLKTKVLEERLAGRGIQVRQAFLRQGEGLKSVLPLAENWLLGTYRNLDLYAATALFPFANADLAHEGGVVLGPNLITGAPVVYNPFVGAPYLLNPHLGIFATSGAGKSFTVRLLIGRQALLGRKAVFIDPEGEHGRMVQALGGIEVRFRPDQVQMNPLELEEDEGAREDEEKVNIRDKIADVKALIATMVEGLGGKIKPQDFVLLGEVIQEEYRSRGFTTDPRSLYEGYSDLDNGVYIVGKRKKKMPTLSDLYRRLEKAGAVDLATMLRPHLRSGSMGIFDGESVVDLGQAPLVAFNIFSLEEKYMRPLAMHIAMSWIWEKYVKKNPKQQKSVVVDEAWMFAKQTNTMEFLEALARRARKRNTALVVSTQNFAEFISLPQGQTVLTNLDTIMLMAQNPNEIDAVARAFKLSEGQREFLLELKRGEALLRAGKQMVAVRIKAGSAKEEELYRT